MLVAHFSNEYPPETTGGLGTYMEALITHQRSRGDDVDLFYLGPSPLSTKSVHLPAFDGEQPLTYAPGELARRSGGRRYDVVVCHDWPGIVVSQELWKNGVPLVYTCHLPLTWDIGEFDDVPCAFSREMEFSALAHADAVVAVSASVAGELTTRFPFTAGKTHVIHHGTDVGFFRPPPDRSTREPGTVAYIGRFYEQKGFDLLPEIFAAVREGRPEARFEIMGVGELEAPVRRRLRELDLRDRVTWHPFSGLDTVRALYRRASVVVMPSRLEPFGLVAVEAMACGAPLVAADTGGLGEIVRDEDTGLLAPPGDAAAAAKCVIRLLTEPGTAARISTSARAAVVRDFDQSRNYERSRALYRRLAGDGPST
ncbi:glycosyltransferase family 4 protein [Streptomyces chryseus]|uniref:glycosyltransferase family 4 protein n=1 Tax=Streptomyces chryseus TaxID=68186 RepID=UPI00110FC571|nr:glycosyltransferase family 4 protein [Streptomyces chryseus]GGX42644.1 glycosyl transferase [Streptomyces chryseus]